VSVSGAPREHLNMQVIGRAGEKMAEILVRDAVQSELVSP